MQKRLAIMLFFIFAITGCSNSDWRTASREPAGIAPSPAVVKDAVIEVYAADAFSWRGWFAVHTWIAFKEQGADEYDVYEVVGWRVKSGYPALRNYKTANPDRYWYGARPEKVLSIQGEKARRLIPDIEAAIARYPWANEYTVFPGPNSNTFPAWVGLQVPELELDMPFNAIGAGYAE
ncbi:DUF3750 domain-containing protein [Alteromonas lipolytica]|uniref:DUF3750 domain-containing protein n=1 Tax=Alteromonas lipolytica TaxID=1856405 RepID=A0A1E8FCQ7_9ALTE|nr:DUF3750 domain-containing protein [Alteromonas lipolytica]OFI33712.1 hypothetical protein BFC17_19230 [Alteromonas lipolytica]GGF69130.1 lipoprotein [Alteromonas lipolytica]